MTTAGYAIPASFSGTAVPKLWNFSVRRSLFGDVVLLVFLLAQCLDGVFTYVGVKTYGIGIEANPLISVDDGLRRAWRGADGRQTIAGCSASAFTLGQVHGAVALLALFYLAVAVFPWMTILFA